MIRPAAFFALLLLATPAGAQIRGAKQPDVRYVPSPDSVVEAMLTMAKVTAADVVYDLGSGDGRIPITAAKQYGALGVGIEIDAMHIREALDNMQKAGVGNRVRFVHQDFFESDISPATVVTLFLYPGVNERLLPKFKRELRPGTRIVSHRFEISDQWPAEQTRDVDGTMIYLWTIR